MIIPISLLIPYRKINEDIQLWTQIRKSTDELNGLIEFPGGKVEKNESPEEACAREIKEETGAFVAQNEIQIFKKYFNDVGEKKIMLMVFLFEDKKGRFPDAGYVALNHLAHDPERIPPANKEILLDLSNFFNEISSL